MSAKKHIGQLFAVLATLRSAITIQAITRKKSHNYTCHNYIGKNQPFAWPFGCRSPSSPLYRPARTHACTPGGADWQHISYGSILVMARLEELIGNILVMAAY